MANIKSAKKRILVIEKKTLKNKMYKSALKTNIKKFFAAVEAETRQLQLMLTRSQLKTLTRQLLTVFLQRTTRQERRADIPVCSTQ